MKSRSRRRGDSGFALLLVFAMAASISIMLYMQLPRAAFQAQRDKEQLLVERGEQYMRGIQLYVAAWKKYPASIEDLERSNGKRYLRRRYKDPMTGKDDWRIIKIDGAGMLTGSLVQKQGAQQKQSQNTFITENAGIGMSNTPLGAAGQNLGLRRRQSEGGSGTEFEPMPSSNGLPPTSQLGQGPGGQAVTPVIPNPLVGQGSNLPPGQQPGTEQSGIGQPGMGQPGIGQPGIGQPGIGQPGIGQPGMGQPGMGQPGMGQPGMGQPGMGQPGQLTGAILGGGQPNQPYPNTNQPGQPPNTGLNPNQQPFPGANPNQPQFPGANPNQPQFPGANPNQPQFPGANPNQPPFANAGQPFPNQGQPFPNAGQTPGGSPNAAVEAINRQLTSARPQNQQPSFPGAPPGFQLGGGIAGVASNADVESIKIYNERQQYNEWEFIYDPKKDKRQQMAAARAQGQQNNLNNGQNPQPLQPGGPLVPGQNQNPQMPGGQMPQMPGGQMPQMPGGQIPQMPGGTPGRR